MATAKLEKVREHFTTCVICTEKYNNPSTLLCHHTFCRSCLTSYIKTQPDAVQNKTIPCPSCRQVTRVPDPAKPVDEWAGQLKPSIIIVGLIDELDQEQGSDADSTNTSNCSPCARLGETTSAVSWCPECEDSLCDRCVKLHRVGSLTRQHELTDVSGNIRRRKHKTMCQEHKEEYIKFHCKDCNKSACHTCCIIYHRGCKSVVTIETMIPDITGILTKKSNILSNKIEMKISRLHIIKEEIGKTENLQKKVQREIRSATEKIIAEIRKKEEELLDELKKVTEEERRQLQADLKTEEIDIQTLNQYREFIKQALESESEMDLYDVYMACQSGVVEVGYIWNTDRFQRPHVTDITFQPHKVNEHYLENLHPGKIGFIYKPLDKLLFSTRLFETTTINTKEDEAEPIYPDLSVVVVHGVEVSVVTDFDNKCVKSFCNRNNKTCHSRLLLDNGPWGITQLKDNQVMVAVPESIQIVTVAVTPDLVLLSTISTSKPYFSISMLGSTSLAAGGIGCVDILNMEGEVMKSVTTYNNVELFAYPAYMCVTNKGHLLVSDCENKTVTYLTSQGDVMWIYSSTVEEELSNPTCITTTSGGDILVVDLKKVIQLSESGQYVRDVLTSQDGLSDPRDCEKKTVTCLTSEGDVMWRYSSTGEGKLSNPRGIPTASGGDILVVDYNLKKVIQLSESGQYVRDVLTSQDGLSDPRGICVDREGSVWMCESENVYQYICS